MNELAKNRFLIMGFKHSEFLGQRNITSWRQIPY